MRQKNPCNRDMESIGLKVEGIKDGPKVEERNLKLFQGPQMTGKA